MDDNMKQLIEKLLELQEEVTTRRIQIRNLTQLLWDKEKNSEYKIIDTKEVREIFGIMPYSELVNKNVLVEDE